MQNRNRTAVALAPTPEPRLYTIKNAAAYLSTTVWYVRSIVWARQIPHLRCGNRIVIDKADLDAFIDSQKVAAA
jgi:excisionase family DNA binding protein